jgi:Beta-galactosidase
MPLPDCLRAIIRLSTESRPGWLLTAPGMAGLLFGVGACMISQAAQAQVSPNNNETSAAPFVEAGEIKPLLEGLISMEDARCLNANNNLCIPDNSISDAFSTPYILHGVVINVTWTQLEPHSGSFSFQPIDEALENIARYNATFNAHPLRAILRVETGQMAPDWVKNMAGGPVSIFRRSNNAPITVPRFWTAEYRKAWRELQDHLAARYDVNPLIAQISNTSCAHESDEPYVNPVDSASIIALYNAGYTNEKFLNCLRASIHDYDAWHITRVDFTQNTFENIVVDATNGEPQGKVAPTDLNPTISIIKAFRTALGEKRAIIGNHDLTNPPHPANVVLYSALQALGKPIEFQTGSPGVPRPNGASTGEFSDWNGTIKLGADIGATAIEVWPSFSPNGKPVQDGWNPIKCNSSVPALECSGQPLDDLLRWNRELEAQARFDRAAEGG